MSIRVAFIGGLLFLLLAATLSVSIIGIQSIQGSVIREAQERVNRDLDMVVSLYQEDLRRFAETMQKSVEELQETADLEDRATRIDQLRARLNLSVLNLCSIEGVLLAGDYPDLSEGIDIAADPILTRALDGNSAWGIMMLDRDRLHFEGGPSLRDQQVIRSPDGEIATESSLMQWFAVPLLNPEGRVTSIIYGGRSFNHQYDRVDQSRRLVYGEDTHEGKPLGTVTYFLGPTRVATNVLDAQGRRAVGTTVSQEVQMAVLDRGLRWHSRAWVVDAWYLSAYTPIRDPNGAIIGMFYVGLLEEPYEELRTRLIARFLIPVGVVFALGLLVTVGIVRRISHPLKDVADQARIITEGSWPEDLASGGSYREIDYLRESFGTMRESIQRRDAELRSKNEELTETNQLLTEANTNYMSTLAFVTHELKSPLAANQGLIDLLVAGNLGEVPASAQEFLVRIKRNSEELQDMVKNYLDLSRAERGELQPDIKRIDVIESVVKPAIEQSRPLFKSRDVKLETEFPERFELDGDAELLRIALSNYLSNAAKYGREQGRARLEFKDKKAGIELSVWNEGEGFSQEDSTSLFGKFNRLQNATTRGKRGSGLGLYLTRQILDSHAGETWAESEQGSWARFGFRLPRSKRF